MPGFEKRKDGEWGVRDKNARTLASDGSGNVVPRVHEPRVGMTYPLVFNRPYYMPEADARVFLKDSSFIVTDEDDNVVAPLSDTALLRKAPDALPPNMVLADVHELTDEALLTRAAQRTEGHKFNSDTAREVMIRFLIDANTPKVASSGGRDAVDGGEVEVEEMGEDGADALRMLQGT